MIRRLLVDRSGIAAVEFSLVVPTMIAIVIATIEFGCILYTYMAAELATGDITRQLTANSIGSSQVSKMVIDRLPKWAQATSTTSTSSAGTAPVIWTVTTSIPIKSATPTKFLSAIYGEKTLTVTSVMQQEPTS